MNQLAINHRLEHDLTCTELLNMAQRELTALFRAVTELFGAQQAEASAEDWLNEMEGRDTLPASAREWRQITARVITQLADRCGNPPALPVSARLQLASY